METFYATLASICFALVGLWWVVVQFKYDLFMSAPGGRLAAYAASMHFVAPGVISLVAVLTTDQVPVWRIGSAVGSIIGIVATISALRAALLTPTQRTAEVALLILFGVMTILSFVTVPLFGVRPILIEALVNVAVIVLGVQFAWQFFVGDWLTKS